LADRCEAHIAGEKMVFSSQSEWGKKWEHDPVTYSIIRDSEDIPAQAEERRAMNLAMTTWDFEIPLRLLWVSKINNPDITIEFKTKEEEPYFIDHPSVLAFAYFPGQGAVSGIIIFNEEYRWSLDGKNVKIVNPDGSESMVKTYNVITVMIHEIGHSLGLRHSESENHADVMDPFYAGMLDLSDEDIFRIRSIYGIRQWNWNLYARVKNWLRLRKRRY
jgi:hypothetical protein